MASLIFPVFHDESGYVAPVVEPRPKPAVGGHGEGPAFRDVLVEQAAQTPSSPHGSDHSATAQATPHAAAKADDSSAVAITPFAEGDTPSFWDILDFINPLQHIPIVNTIYRELTGDKIGAVASIAGGALLGGPIGLGVAVANLSIRGTTGQDLGEHVIAMFSDDEPTGTDGGTRLAQQEAPQPAAAAGNDARSVAAVAPERRSYGTIDVQFRPVPPRGSMAVPASMPAAASGGAVPPIVKASTAPAAATEVPAGAGNDWFVKRFTEAMDRYDQMSKPKQPDDKP